jgi:hypothetical protein
MSLVQACGLGLLVVAIAGLGHACLRWMDRRGWVFYTSEPTAPIGARTAMALMEFETLFNPPVTHVIEYRRHGDLWVQESGESPPAHEGDI